MYDLGPTATGHYPRVTIEQPILDVTELLALQDRLVAASALKSPDRTSQFRPTQATNLHVTYLHLGKFGELLTEVLLANPDAKEEDLRTGIQQVLEAGLAAVTTDTPIRVTGIEPFGTPAHPVVAATLERDPGWLAKRQPMLDALAVMLRDLGISDPAAFIAQSPNLRYGAANTYSPHLTIGTIPPRTQVPLVVLPQAPLTLGPTVVYGALPVS